MRVTLLVSIALHVAAVTAMLLLLHPAAVVDLPGKPAEVELVMIEHAGEARPIATPSPSAAAQPPAASGAEPPPAAVAEPPPATVGEPPPAAASKPRAEENAEKSPGQAVTPTPPTRASVEPKPDAPQETDAPETVSIPSPPASPAPIQEARPAADPEPAATPAPVQEARRPEEPRPPEPKPPEPQPPEPKPPEPTPPAERPATPPAATVAPTVTLSGTDSPSEARAMGDRILPAAPDAVFHNRPPEYPIAAARNGEHGTVVVLIHVSPAGTAAGVDVVRSSGYAQLDHAAREAVARWRFLPAVRDGQPVASDMTMGFIFDNTE